MFKVGEDKIVEYCFKIEVIVNWNVLEYVLIIVCCGGLIDIINYLL